MLEPNFNFYDGSRTFTWLADLCGLSVDLINFLICQLLGLFLASLYRSILHPSKVSSVVRHTVALTQGLAFGYFCFGRQAIHIAGLPTLCYIVMRTQNPAVVQRTVMLVSMIYLLSIHLIRQIYDYGSQSLDITGPLMIITQKVTSLAFSIHDGFLQETQHELTKTQQYHAVKKLPSALEYFSYVLHFQSIMAGPLVFYRDYIEFIEGYNFLSNAKSNNNFDNGHRNEVILEPSPLKPVVKKLVGSIMCAIIFVKFTKVYPVKNMKDDEFVNNTSIVNKIWYIMLSTTAVRFKYYHAWLLADAICNNSGLGFNGYDHEGNAKWDLLSNIHVLQFEFATSMRDAINNWNIGTNRWLRSVVYERVPKHYGTPLTFALSALWHGFYPGYYMCFATGAILVTAARITRRILRSHFQSTQFTRIFYDILTCMATRLGIAYCVFPFVLLDFYSGITLYLKFYCGLHLVALAIMFLVPKFMQKQTNDRSHALNINNSMVIDNNISTNNNNNNNNTRKVEKSSTKNLYKFEPLVENDNETNTTKTTTNIPQTNFETILQQTNYLNNNNNNFLADIDLDKRQHVKHDKCEIKELSCKFREKIHSETKNIEEFIDKTVTETVSSIVDLKRDLMRDPKHISSSLSLTPSSMATKNKVNLAHQDYENMSILRKRNNNTINNENGDNFTMDDGHNHHLHNGCSGVFLKKEIVAINSVVQQANNMLPAVLSNGHVN